MARKETRKKTGTGARRGQAVKGRGAKPEPSRGGTATISHDEIARRAREIWVQRGCPTGEDEKIWLEAEVQLTHELVVK